MSFYDGILQGINYGRKWTKLLNNVNKLKPAILKFEETLLDATLVRLGPQIHSLFVRIDDELVDIEYLLSDEANVNRETDLETAVDCLRRLEEIFFRIREEHLERVYNSVH